MKKIIAAVLCLATVLCLFSCAKSPEADKGGDSVGTESVKVEMSVKDFGKITLELYPDIAPITVENFVSLVKDGFYDGLTFHRVVNGFMIQGGDPNGNGTGGSDKTIKGEFAENGVENNLSHKRGVISMARSNNPDSASSQFFIMHQDNDYLDGKYAAFGKVTDGMDVVDAIASVDVELNFSGTEESSPVTPVVIEYVKVLED
ncbi:MAG: peptidylprolyl isomerase [Candidatus Avispirillum sp.]